MKIAIASQNQRTVTAHAGRCRHFFIYDTERDSPPESLFLDADQTLASWHGGTHALEAVVTLIAGSAGNGVAEKLACRGVHLLATSERDASRAYAGFLDGTLPILPIRTEMAGRSIPGQCVRPTAPLEGARSGSQLNFKE